MFDCPPGQWRISVSPVRPLLLTAALVAALGVAGPARSATSTDPMSVNDQTDGVTSKRKTTVAVYCRKDPCNGSMKLTSGDTKFASATFAIPPKTTFKIPMKLSHVAFDVLRGSPGRKMKVTATAKLASGQIVSHVITLKA